MMQIDWFQAFLIAATSLGSAVLALILSGRLARRAPARSLPATVPAPEPAVFLFEGDGLVDATAPARALLDAAPMGGTEWARLLAFVAPRFPDFETGVAALRDGGQVEFVAQVPGDRPAIRLLVQEVDGLKRITLFDPEAEGQGRAVDALSFRAMEDELDHMRKALDRLPGLVWRDGADGQIVWANRAYILQSQAFAEGEEGFAWPLPRVFPAIGEVTPGAANRTRVTTRSAEGDEADLWFDCFRFPTDSGVLNFALPADAAARAEQSLRSFVQTLAKTFADLPIGLAVFDRSRKLQLFNPALVDLTMLTAEFLTSRPSLYAFLDRLREARMMPEPKDYRSWRLQMTELEKAAAAGFHSETWSLPGGQTYRVTGRPHPDGAVAFLFEDITTEMTLTRRFRAELELGQHALDHIREAVAVFRASGELAFSNERYDCLWGVDSATSLARVTIRDSIRIWEDDCAPSPLWTDVRNFAFVAGDRPPVLGEIRKRDGTRLSCHLRAIGGGAVLAGFSFTHDMAPQGFLAPVTGATGLVKPN